MRPPATLAICAVAALLAPAGSGQTRASANVTGVRFWTLPETTRVVVEISQDFTFRSDRVPTPSRLFFDISGARPKLGTRGQHTVAVNDKLLRQIRVAETQPGTTRVVFDLETDVDYVASQLAAPHRLIVELRPAGPKLPPQISMSVTGGQVLARKEPPLPDVTADDLKIPPRSPDPGRLLSATTPAETKIPAVLPQPPRAVPPQPLPEAPPAKVTLAKRQAPVFAPPKPAALPKHSQGSLTRVLGLKVGRIVLDPGHGGHDTGTIGPGGLAEKDLVLDVVKRLGALIETRLGSQVVYTREDDSFIPLEARTEIANQQKADLFLSIHANSSPVRNASGVETYYLNFTTDQAALEVAARENATAQMGVHDLGDVIQKIALRDKVDESREFAGRLQRSLYAASLKANGRTRNRGVKKAPFVVLIGARMPSVLAEIGFVSNPKDESLMKKPEHRQRLAEGLFRGLQQYAATLSQFQVAKND